MDNIIKSGGGAVSSGRPTKQDMELISAYTKGSVEAKDLYVFQVLLCDNDIDRDNERFADEALETLGSLFVGKTGIFDHQWSAKEQVARIFQCSTRGDGRLTSDGRAYKALYARAYMLNNRDNQGLIQSIEAGILKEVSISCSVKRQVCSICGGEYGDCPHEKGRDYGGKVCHVVLTEPKDAYEWSFVAVPAQRQAGVIKKYDGRRRGEMKLKEFLLSDQGRAYVPELEELEKQAELGMRYLNRLRDEVVRLGLLSACGLKEASLRAMTARMEEPELEELRKAYEDKAREQFPVVSQLTMAKKHSRDCQEDYLI